MLSELSADVAPLLRSLREPCGTSMNAPSGARGKVVAKNGGCSPASYSERALVLFTQKWPTVERPPPVPLAHGEIQSIPARWTVVVRSWRHKKPLAIVITPSP